jgi:MFS superfamily sulfate permease-like transporter
MKRNGFVFNGLAFLIAFIASWNLFARADWTWVSRKDALLILVLTFMLVLFQIPSSNKNK